jgi:SanA protein
VLKRIIKMVLTLFITLVIVGALILIIPRVITYLYALPRIYNAKSAPDRTVAIVFGAGLWRDGSPTPVLRDRVFTAAELYFAGKVKKILMSGDNRTEFHNEPESMRQYALSLGVPDEDIVLDYAGWRTYDTCYRAKSIFHVDSTILVTQAFHLDRAIYTCNILGLPSVGVIADQREYRKRALLWWNSREIPATLVALWELHFARPLPILGEPEPIFPKETE